MTVPPLAHGFGDIGDLPVTLPMVLLAAAGTVVGVAAALSARATGTTKPRVRRGIRLPAVATTAVDHPAARTLLRLGAAALLGTAAVTAAIGPDDVLASPAPALVFEVFWVGVLLGCSLLLGPLWRAASPLRAVSAALARASGDADDQRTRPLPDGLGIWPAAVMLALVVWAESVLSRSPLIVLLLLGAYAVVGVGAAAVFGRDWYRYGDGFEVYSTMVGWLAPLDRAADGRLVLRSPRRRMASVESPAGLLAVIAVLAGGHLFDSLTDSLAWQQLLFGRPRVALQTIGLTACIVAAGAVAATVTRATFLRPALVPVVVAYAIAHYFGPLLVEAQHAVITLSDPLGNGADLFGLAGRRVDYNPVRAPLAAVAQLVAFIGFHAVATVVAHDRSVARYDARSARAVQFPLRVLLVASVVGGVALRFGGSG